MLKKLQKCYKKVFFKVKKSVKKVKKKFSKFKKFFKKSKKFLKSKNFFLKFEKIKLKINYAIRIFPIRIFLIRILPNPHFTESSIDGFLESRSACLICQISVFRT